MTVSIATRFAPSPTGRLHLGHAVSAVAAHDFARRRGGRFLLRIEDIDGTRSRPEHSAAILADLEWLGLGWDGEPTYQSRRQDRYEAALDVLKGQGLVYPCFCTRGEIAREIAAAGSAPHGPGGQLYPGTCRMLDSAEREARCAEPHAWRLDMAKAAAVAGPLRWQDELAGDQLAEPAVFGDVVVARKDAPSSYHLAVTVDDAEQGITHIVRGRDLFAATSVHRLLQALLDLPVPTYQHHLLVGNAAGQRLAKRHGAPTLEAMRLAGVDGRALARDLRAGRLPTGFSWQKD